MAIDCVQAIMVFRTALKENGKSNLRDFLVHYYIYLSEKIHFKNVNTRVELAMEISILRLLCIISMDWECFPL